MTDVATDLDIEPGRAAAEEAGGSSVLDRVKARRAERLADKPTLFNIAGWDGELKAGYRIIERKDLDRMVKSLRRRHGNNGTTQSQLTNADLDFLASACDSVVAVDSDTGEQEQVSEGYNQVLADRLDVPELGSARKLLAYLFADRDGNVNTIAIAAHAMRVAQWMQDPTADDGDQDDQDPLS